MGSRVDAEIVEGGRGPCRWGQRMRRLNRRCRCLYWWLDVQPVGSRGLQMGLNDVRM